MIVLSTPDMIRQVEGVCGELDGQVLQVLVSGSGYGSVYWDFPYQPDTYSYTRPARGGRQWDSTDLALPICRTWRNLTGLRLPTDAGPVAHFDTGEEPALRRVVELQ